MLSLEVFPTNLDRSYTRAAAWLASYENLQDRFGTCLMLYEMRKSLLRLSNRGHHALIESLGHGDDPVKPITAGMRKYMSAKGLDRLAMIRHHTYRSTPNN